MGNFIELLFHSLLHRQIHPEHAVGKLSAGKAVDSAVDLHFIDPEYLLHAVAEVGHHGLFPAGPPGILKDIHAKGFALAG